MMHDAMQRQIGAEAGIVAALDQSGGSTPDALRRYGVPETALVDEPHMFDLIHSMRRRIITAPAFTGDKVIGAILFRNTLEREIKGLNTARFLWRRHIVPFLKVDEGLLPEQAGVRLMKPIEALDETLAWAASLDVFGTKARSVIRLPERDGIQAIVDQQFDYANRVARHGLTPIIEPEVLIDSPAKREAERMLRDALLAKLDDAADGHPLLFKLTLPEEPDLYRDLVAHPRVLRTLALSGGYDGATAAARLARNAGMIASFSRALIGDLRIGMTEEAFSARLGETIDALYDASTIKAALA
jgi:fructose-bisphosphate aldolase class I